MTSLTLHLDDEMKERLEIYASKRGQSMLDSAFYLLNRGFEIAECDDKEPIDIDEDIDEDFDLDGPYTEEEEALFYSSSNLSSIEDGIRQLEEGKIVEVTIEELKAMIK